MPQTAPDQFIVNQQFGPYRIESVLGEGGVATVYAARKPNSPLVALKILAPNAARSPIVRQCFEQEYKITSRLNHPGIVRATDTGIFNGRYYIAMTLVEGQTLAQLILKNKNRRLGEDAALNITRQIADTLNYLHQRGYVHRDIKVSNIMIADRGGRAILIDFGTAWHEETPRQPEDKSVFGTPAFVSPEQARGDAQIDGRSDLYSLGIVLYFMVTGQKPFYGKRDQLLHAHIYEEPEPPTTHAYVSKSLDAVVLKAIAKDPKERFQNGAEMIEALDKVEPAPPKPDLTQRLRSWLRVPAAS